MLFVFLPTARPTEKAPVIALPPLSPYPQNHLTKICIPEAWAMKAPGYTPHGWDIKPADVPAAYTTAAYSSPSMPELSPPAPHGASDAAVSVPPAAPADHAAQHLIIQLLMHLILQPRPQPQQITEPHHQQRTQHHRYQTTPPLGGSLQRLPQPLLQDMAHQLLVMVLASQNLPKRQRRTLPCVVLAGLSCFLQRRFTGSTSSLH